MPSQKITVRFLEAGNFEIDVTIAAIKWIRAVTEQNQGSIQSILIAIHEELMATIGYDGFLRWEALEGTVVDLGDQRSLEEIPMHKPPTERPPKHLKPQTAAGKKQAAKKKPANSRRKKPNEGWTVDKETGEPRRAVSAHRPEPSRGSLLD